MHGQVSGGPDRNGPRSRWAAMVLFAVALYGGTVAIFADLASDGPSIRIDSFVASIWTFKGPYSYLLADQLDRIGMREICVPFLLIGAIAVSRRIGSIRAVLIATVGTLTLNFAVGVLKLASGRESPRTGGPEMFAGDNVLYPSGHAANVIFHYGLVVALLIRYGMVPNAWRRRLYVTLVALVFVLMTWVSVYRHTHWFSDLIAGGMIGTALLVLCLAADREWTRLVPLARRLSGPAWVLVERPVEWARPYIMVPLRERRRARREAESLMAAAGAVPVAEPSASEPASSTWGAASKTPPVGNGVSSSGSSKTGTTALGERDPNTTRDPRGPDALTGPPTS
jgi:membrane-associated phospholipid phosphatase